MSAIVTHLVRMHTQERTAPNTQQFSIRIIRIEGYITSRNIDSTSTAEYELSQLILGKKDSLTDPGFIAFMTKYNFKPHSWDFDELEQTEPKYNYYEYEIDYLEQGFRILLVFQGQQLAAVFHNRRLKLPGYKDLPLVNAHLLWLQQADDPAVKHLIRKYNQIVYQHQHASG